MSVNNIITIEKLMSSPFESGGLLVSFNQNRVNYQQTELTLQPKVLELLVLLCAAQGQTLNKEMLTSALWPDTIVGPDSLANTVTRLRKVLNDDAKNPNFIETVQRKGYRWRHTVNLNNANDTSPNKYTINRVAVLAAISIICLSVGWLLIPLNKEAIDSKTPHAKFPFPELHIERLAEGGYEVQVTIDGELTQERKIAMLKEIKRITGEEHSDMIFTVDPIEPSCQADLGGDSEDKGKTKNAACAEPHK